jgi:hypothetical protein
MRFAIVFLLSTTTVCFADEKADKLCLEAAFRDYITAEQALLTQALGGLTVEATIARRRLEEQYCIRFAGCLAGPQSTGMAKVPPDMLKLALAAEFSRCLDDEAEENLKNRVK